MSDDLSSLTLQFTWSRAWWKENGDSGDGALALALPLIYGRPGLGQDAFQLLDSSSSWELCFTFSG